MDPWCQRGVWTGWTTTWCRALCSAPVSWPVVDSGPETGRLELVNWRMALVCVAPFTVEGEFSVLGIRNFFLQFW
uniref:Uncharacterized protein n=1 Tax=Fagus sylvatica TaxID=28930 RepID=A0A2N9GV91_FAGSY